MLYVLTYSILLDRIFNGTNLNFGHKTKHTSSAISWAIAEHLTSQCMRPCAKIEMVAR